MKPQPTAIALCIVLLLFSGPAIAAQVYGTVTEGSTFVPNVTVIIVCGAEEYRSQTDNRGSFGVYVGVTGRCLLSVAGFDAQPLEVYSYPKPVNYRIYLQRKPDGTYQLDRR
jgi:hypothetical protein